MLIVILWFFSALASLLMLVNGCQFSFIYCLAKTTKTTQSNDPVHVHIMKELGCASLIKKLSPLANPMHIPVITTNN